MQFISIVIAAIAAIMSAWSLTVALDTRDRTVASLTREILDKYLIEAKLNTTSNECIGFANHVEPDAFRLLFSHYAVEFPFSRREADSILIRCLGKPPATPARVTADEARDIRMKVFSKLNAYEIVLTTIVTGEGNPQLLCKQVVIPFRKGAKDLLIRASSFEPKPEQFASMHDEYTNSLLAARQELCKPFG